MEFDGAVIKEHDITYAVVSVKKGVLEDTAAAEAAIRAYRPAFPGLPVVLVAQDLPGTPTYYGPADVVNMVGRLPLNQIPWKRYTV